MKEYLNNNGLYKKFDEVFGVIEETGAVMELNINNGFIRSLCDVSSIEYSLKENNNCLIQVSLSDGSYMDFLFDYITTVGFVDEWEGKNRLIIKMETSSVAFVY